MRFNCQLTSVAIKSKNLVCQNFQFERLMNQKPVEEISKFTLVNQSISQFIFILAERTVFSFIGK